MLYSIIIPVYNRPDEIDELLDSLQRMTAGNFEVIVVEDGSSIPCKDIVDKYQSSSLTITYLQKPNAGPGPARNDGAQRSQGDYLIFLDSDCVVPPNYLSEIDRELAARPSDAFGGPDCAAPSFTSLQKAINYSMTSFLTTGGIRGGQKRLDKFYPRSFNLGVSKQVFLALGGFSGMRYGEDIDFSIRLFKAGYRCRLFPNAWVYHKRRTDLWQFFRQVFHSGAARICLNRRHPRSLRIVHILPAAFTLVVCTMLALTLCRHPAILLPLALYTLLLFGDAIRQTRSLRIAVLAVLAAFIQLFAYGSGFLVACLSAVTTYSPTPKKGCTRRGAS